MRSGRDLIEATKPYSVECRVSSWWYLSSTLAVLAAGTWAAAQPVPWPLRLLLSAVDGLLIVRDQPHERTLTMLIEATDLHIPFLLRKADRVEEYLQQR